MNNPGRVLIVEEDRSTLGLISDTFEMMNFEAARALEYKKISNEYQGLCKGFVWGGIISISIWAVLGVMIANLLGH
jgi:hypothetical protein